MVGVKQPRDRLALDDELYGWPSAIREQGAWVRKTDDAPVKKLVSPPQEEDAARGAQDDDWFLGAYRRYHAGLKEVEMPRVPAKSSDKLVTDKLVTDKLIGDKLGKRIEEVAYEEQPTVAMFARRSRPQPAGPTVPTGRTRNELYREAQRRGIEGRSKMNKRQLAEALGALESKPPSRE